ncbi:MAG: HNH endonuclease signature motif containing protein [Candidatus Omnitrophota bacterium]|nr:HNH endonuclease signature motif containing protein [Candidatus Omnitrophota bacterium]
MSATINPIRKTTVKCWEGFEVDLSESNPEVSPDKILKNFIGYVFHPKSTLETKRRCIDNIRRIRWEKIGSLSDKRMEIIGHIEAMAAQIGGMRHPAPKWGEIAKECLICGETRVVDRCHIISRCMDENSVFQNKEYRKRNILPLCPTHHKCFDRGKLTQEELGKIKDRILYIINEYKVFLESLVKSEEYIGLSREGRIVFSNKTLKELYHCG